MTRWAWRILVTASLLLLLATVGMWVRAQWTNDALMYEWIGGASEGPALRDVWVSSCRGSLAFCKQHSPIVPWDPANAPAPDQATKLGMTTWHGPAVAFTARQTDPGWDSRGWAFGGFAWAGASYDPLPGSAYPLSLRERLIWVAAISETTLALPWWFLSLLFALAPARACWTWRRQRRRPPHACVACGYDLRATADSAGPLLATCPECGRASGQLTARA